MGDLVSLVKNLEVASREASSHPRPFDLQTYSMDPDSLPEDVRKSTQCHIGRCDRCRVSVEDTRSRASFFHRQKTMLDDCDSE